MLNFFMYLFITLFIVVSLFLILVVLIQKGRGGGLASAFGGGGGGNTAFGSKTGDVLTWVTSIVFGVFLLLAVGLNLLADAHNEQLIGGTPEEQVESTPLGGSMPQGVQVPPAPSESPAETNDQVPGPGVTPPPADAPANPAPAAPAPAAPLPEQN